METVAHYTMLFWLSASITVALLLAWNPRKPFIFPLDRGMQVRLYLSAAGGALFEFVMLLVGGFWS